MRSGVRHPSQLDGRVGRLVPFGPACVRRFANPLSPLLLEAVEFSLCSLVRLALGVPWSGPFRVVRWAQAPVVDGIIVEKAWRILGMSVGQH